MSGQKASADGTVREAAIRDCVPLLYVDDIERSVDFYRDTLGFSVAQSWQPEGKLAWCRLQRGGAAVMLQQACEEDPPAAQRRQGVAFYFFCDSADALHAEFSQHGRKLAPPQEAFYGMNQLLVTDPDGYALWFQSETRGA